MALAKFQVERRPITSNGNVVRGLKNGDYVLTVTNPENITQFVSPTPLSATGATAIPARYVPVGVPVPPLGTTGNVIPATSHVQEVSGEPWLVHSSHSSIESALDSAAPLASAIGSDNVRIVQVLSHKMNFKLN